MPDDAAEHPMLRLASLTKSSTGQGFDVFDRGIVFRQLGRDYKPAQLTHMAMQVTIPHSASGDQADASLGPSCGFRVPRTPETPGGEGISANKI